ncbi:hypothetical protein L1987_33137 [Smallanthus sonchifolius]|uniref:Uncharacterized protein n=1 Tax=Smallanthus sonchifolius TaxID=185202 RepID=A0ACB9HPI9_9ASTR|nr:hypothetical protein L1987_33137 [Smallanthus sonchifolius]
MCSPYTALVYAMLDPYFRGSCGARSLSMLRFFPWCSEHKKLEGVSQSFYCEKFKGVLTVHDFELLSYEGELIVHAGELLLYGGEFIVYAGKLLSNKAVFFAHVGWIDKMNRREKSASILEKLGFLYKKIAFVLPQSTSMYTSLSCFGKLFAFPQVASMFLVGYCYVYLGLVGFVAALVDLDLVDVSYYNEAPLVHVTRMCWLDWSAQVLDNTMLGSFFLWLKLLPLLDSFFLCLIASSFELEPANAWQHSTLVYYSILAALVNMCSYCEKNRIMSWACTGKMACLDLVDF